MRQCPLKHKECPLKYQLVGRVVRSLEIQVAKATNRQKNGSVEESTKTGKSILRPASDQSNCKKARPALILIKRHVIIDDHYIGKLKNKFSTFCF